MENNIGNIKSINENGNVGIKSDQNIFSENFYFDNFYDIKDYKSFIKNTESLIRKSAKYNNYLFLLKNNVDKACIDNIQSNITSDDAIIELHHYPFTLYDIVDIVASYKFLKNEKINTFNLANEIMNLHYANKIGLVPLTITNHQLAHDGKLFISENQILGRYNLFYEQYEEGISAELKEKIESLKNDTTNGAESDYLRLYE